MSALLRYVQRNYGGQLPIMTERSEDVSSTLEIDATSRNALELTTVSRQLLRACLGRLLSVLFVLSVLSVLFLYSLYSLCCLYCLYSLLSLCTLRTIPTRFPLHLARITRKKSCFSLFLSLSCAIMYRVLFFSLDMMRRDAEPKERPKRDCLA